MIPIAQNRAALDPRHTLSPSQQNALGAISFFKHQDYHDGIWQIGNKRFALSTIRKLQAHELVEVRRGEVQLTQAGSIAADRLRKGTSQ